MPIYQYWNSHCGDKTIFWPSHLHNGTSHIGFPPPHTIHPPPLVSILYVQYSQYWVLLSAARLPWIKAPHRLLFIGSVTWCQENGPIQLKTQVKSTIDGASRFHCIEPCWRCVSLNRVNKCIVSVSSLQMMTILPRTPKSIANIWHIFAIYIT